MSLSTTVVVARLIGLCITSQWKQILKKLDLRKISQLLHIIHENNNQYPNQCGLGLYGHIVIMQTEIVISYIVCFLHFVCFDSFLLSVFSLVRIFTSCTPHHFSTPLLLLFFCFFLPFSTSSPMGCCSWIQRTVLAAERKMHNDGNPSHLRPGIVNSFSFHSTPTQASG